MRRSSVEGLGDSRYSQSSVRRGSRRAVGTRRSGRTTQWRRVDPPSTAERFSPRCLMLRSRLCGELDEISHRSWRRRRSSPHNAKDYRAAGNRQFTVRVPVGRVFRQGIRTGNGACLQRLCLHFQVHTRGSDWSSRGRRVPAMRAHREQGNHHARFIYVVKLLAAMRLSKRLRQLRHITEITA